MTLMNKRIAIISTNQHLIPFGGLGSFIKGLNIVLKENNIVTDIVLDKEPSEKVFLEELNISGTVYYSDNVLSYSNHANTFAFKDSVNFEKTINFRNALMKAMSKNIYDYIVINSVEALDAVIALGIGNYIPVILYTHLEWMLGQKNKDQPFSDNMIEYYQKLMGMSNIIVATQSKFNAKNIKNLYSDNVIVLPMPIPEEGLLTNSSKKREGILFNGRWEPRKRPMEFIQLIKDTGLPARVMTSKKGAIKFEDALKEIECEDYIIKHSLQGQNKVDFISSCVAQYHPSLEENFPFAVLEGLCQLPVLVDGENVYWHKGFEEYEFNLIHSNKTNRADIIKGIKKTNSNMVEYQNNAKKIWTKFLLNAKKDFTVTSNKFTNTECGFYDDFIKSLNRIPSIEDIGTCYRNKSNFNLYNFKEGTYYSKDSIDIETIEKESTGIESFFE